MRHLTRSCCEPRSSNAILALVGGFRKRSEQKWEFGLYSPFLATSLMQRVLHDKHTVLRVPIPAVAAFWLHEPTNLGRGPIWIVPMFAGVRANNHTSKGTDAVDDLLLPSHGHTAAPAARRSSFSSFASCD